MHLRFFAILSLRSPRRYQRHSSVLHLCSPQTNQMALYAVCYVMPQLWFGQLVVDTTMLRYIPASWFYCLASLLR